MSRGGSERLKNLPRVTQQACRQTPAEPQVVFSAAGLLIWGGVVEKRWPGRRLVSAALGEAHRGCPQPPTWEKEEGKVITKQLRE